MYRRLSSAFIGGYGAVSCLQAYGLAGLGVGFIIFLSSLTVFASNGFKPTGLVRETGVERFDTHRALD